jgi:hypothetical protein
MPPADFALYGNARPAVSEPISHVVFAITSANQQFSRYNPLPFHIRAIGVDRFAHSAEFPRGVVHSIFGIPHYPNSLRFASIILEEVEQQTEGELDLQPHNCVVLCSTPALIAQFVSLGFGVLPAELTQPGAPYPNTLMSQLGQLGENWISNVELKRELAPSSHNLLASFPYAVRHVQRLWQDPLLTDEGSLTETRDYASYAWEMSQPTVISLKYNDIRSFIKEGRIVDEGCADGALLTAIARDFPDSDLIGLEITGEFMARCQEMQRAGVFGNSYVHFHQRNILFKVFKDNSLDTTICNSTTHELYSYGQGEQTLRHYMQLKYAQTKPGGRIIIRDVIGPEDADRPVWLWLNTADGADVASPFSDFSSSSELESYLAWLSTFSLFIRFANDFLPTQGKFNYELADFGGKRYARLSLRNAAEFILAKDYHNNWKSEMHEAFCFFALSDWLQLLEDVGFTPVVDALHPERGSRAYTNPWVKANRWEGKVALFEDEAGQPGRPLPDIPTNGVLVAEKR